MKTSEVLGEVEHISTLWNTISLGWYHMQRFTQCPPPYLKPLGQMSATNCTKEPHCLKPYQLTVLETCSVLMSSVLQFTIAQIALPTGDKIFESTASSCGETVDKLKLGFHGLSCPKNAGRFPRHSGMNSILKRSLVSINLPSALVPVVLTRYGRRPDELGSGT